jgi:hypothetical protein
LSIRYLNAVWDLDIPTTQKMVALVLADHADEHGRSFPSVARMMKMSSLAERSVQNAINWLEENGHLVREMRCGKSTVYRLTPAGDAPPNDVHPRTKCTPTPAGDAPHPRTTCTPTPAPRAPITINRTINEPKEQTKPRDKRASAVSKPDGVPESVWADFLATRKAKRAPLTATALDDIAREADKAGMPLADALTMCCARGWQGFRAEWVGGSPAANGGIGYAGAV